MAWLLLLGWMQMCAAWAMLLFEQRRFRRDGLLLAPVAPETDALQPTVTVIIPVRDASTAAERCVRSIISQIGVRMLIVVVDDRSAPVAAAQLRALERLDTRVVVRRVDLLPEGWLGKSNALQRGAADAGESDWLLFLDDDCTLDSPTAVYTACRCAELRSAQLLTLWPRHDGHTLAENLVIPLCGGIIALWFGPRRFPWSVRRAYGNGQFLLLDRDAYLSIGGHGTVRSNLIEDVALARVMESAGMSVAVASGARLFSVRMYDSLSGAINGWTRIFVGALRSGWKIAGSMLWLVFGSLLPIGAAPLLCWMIIAELSQGHVSAITLATNIVCAIHLALLFVVSWRFWGMGGCDRRALVQYPISVLLVLWVLVRAAWTLLVSRRVEWRGVRYQIDREGRIVAAS
jgi:cellulose synthase/poly-beta-1,6-N-acetylglucosamine synthase-like glycosyltransferase